MSESTASGAWRVFKCSSGHMFAVDNPPVAHTGIVCPLCGSVGTQPEPELTATGVQWSTLNDDTARASGDDADDDIERTEAVTYVESLSQTDAHTTVENVDDRAHVETVVDSGIAGTGRAVGRDSVSGLPRYQLIRELGRGAFGVVYRVRDERLGHDVAMKRLMRVNPDGLRMFKQEFRTLADIAHPNIASLYNLHSDGEDWAFTMELLDAVEFNEYVWSGFSAKSEGCRVDTVRMSGEGTRLSESVTSRLCEALKQLALGLNALHAAGVLHRDIKHSNVMVTTEGRVVLLDFGVAGSMDSGDTGRVQGTPRYMAPEQAQGRATTAATDWYAVGIMLYEILTGYAPYRGGMRAILKSKLTEPVTPPAELEPSVPAELNDLCVQLLQIDPSHRPTAEDVLRCIGADAEANELSEALPGFSRDAAELVGRDLQLQQLRDCYALVANGGSAAEKTGVTEAKPATGAHSVFVHGRSGMGKSILVERFLDELSQRTHALVLRGRCYQQESVPFKALDSVVDSVAAFLRGLPDAAARVLIPDDCRPLARVFPILGKMPGIDDPARPSVDNVEQNELRQRAGRGLRELLLRIGQRKPLVVYIDDLQWGDVDSAQLLVDLVRPPGEPQMLLLGSYRSENVETSPCLIALNDAYASSDAPLLRQDISVESLTAGQATELALQLLGSQSQRAREIAERIAEESAGWPFFVWELAQHVQHDPDITGRALELDDVIWSRVSRLPDSRRCLLELIAVAARPVLVDVAWQAVDEVDRGHSLLAELRLGNFIRTTESQRGTLVETYHDRIRESVVDRLTVETITGYHLRTAEAIERMSRLTAESREQWCDSFETPTVELTPGQWGRVFDLAYHFTQAGRVDRALPFALIAAERTRQQDALEVAEQHYRIVDGGAEDAPLQVRFRLENGLGDVLMRQGHYDEAERRLTAARELADSQLLRAQTDSKLGELVLKRGDMKRAAGILEAALRDLGQWVPRGTASVAAGLLWQVFVQTLHTGLPRFFVHRRKTELPPIESVRVGLLGHLSYTNWFAKGSVQTMWSQLVQVNRAERYLPSQELAWAWSTHAVAMSMIPLRRRAVRYAQQSLAIRRMYGNLWGEGQTLHFLGASLHASARIREALEAWQEAITKFEQAGDWWEANFLGYQLSWGYYHLGELEKSVECAERAYYSGPALGDDQSVPVVIGVWSLASRGNVPPDVIEAELQRKGYDSQGLTVVKLGAAVRRYWLGDLEGALAYINEAHAIIREKSLRNVNISVVYPWRATVLRQLLSRESSGSEQSGKLMKTAKAATRAAVRIGKAFRTQLPHALREAGELALLQDQSPKARRLFERSLMTAERYDLVLQQRLTRERMLELWPDSKSESEPAR